VTKAEALRRAQQSILQNPKYSQHPYYWAPYVLVGNWL
jgi:CHAT domain-containing protein